MSRFVVPRDTRTLRAGGGDGGDGDDYLTRVAKYVPSEVVAFYLFINGAILAAPAGSLPGDRFIWHIGAFLLCWVATPVYLVRRASAGQPKRLQIVLSSVAFPVWAYAVGGAVFAAYYTAAMGSILVATFTFVAGLFAPRPGDP